MLSGQLDVHRKFVIVTNPSDPELAPAVFQEISLVCVQNMNIGVLEKDYIQVDSFDTP